MAESAADKGATRKTLPTDVTPVRYEVVLDVDLDRFVFDGTADIALTVNTATKSISLHARELDIQCADVTFTSGDQSMKPLSTKFVAKDYVARFDFEEELALGEGRLSVKFVGQLNNQMAGFYRSSYTAANGETRTMASTQFEALDARRAFPCWDEPAAKAVFSVTLLVPATLTALSNMPEQTSTLLADGKKRVTFMDTPVMSTYLLAMCVGEFDFVQAMTEHGVVIRVYTPPGKCAQGQFSLDCARKTLDMYDDFFQVPYPLPKLDMIAIPEFACGAMENWGLVTYREVDVLIDPVKASSQQKQRVCTVVTHELAHQWFGNLVTMQWWDDLWLNEGFASFMQTWAADKLFPDWAMWEQFVTDDQAAALRLDALRSSHPIQVPIAWAEEVEEVFDAISYCKGASIIRMMYDLLGLEDFQEGLRIYMGRHKYGNTETIDLWNAWGEASGKPVAKIMATWTEQMGFPALSIVESKWTDTTATFKLRQEWFLADGADLSAEEAAKTWAIPVAAGSSKGTTPITVFDTKEFEVEVAVAGPDDYVKLNYGQPVPLRVLYTKDLLARLAKGVKSKSLPPKDRAALLADCYSMVKAGKLDPSELFNLLAAYADEDDATVWESLAATLGGLAKVLMGDPAIGGSFEKFVGAILSRAMARVGWESREDDGHLGKLVRGTVIGLLGSFAPSDDVVAEACKRFDAMVADPADAAACPSEYRTSVFRIAFKTAPDAAAETARYNALLGLFAAYEDNIEKKRVLNSIGFGPSEAAKTRALDWATSGAVKLQDFFYSINSVSGSSKAGADVAYAYFKANFAKYKGMLSSASPSLMNAVIVYSCSGFASAERADDIAAFFAANPMPQSQRRIDQMLESLRTSAALLTLIQQSDAAQPAFWDALSAAL